MSRYRLVTQNLLASAAQAVIGPPTKAAVEDLASLITTLALYDGVVILGDPDLWDRYAQQSPLIASLKSAQLLILRKLDSLTIERVARLSRTHLATATNVTDFPALERFLEASYLARLCYPTLGIHPDGHMNLSDGRDWILTTPTGKDFDKAIQDDLAYARSAYFYVRTFFYIAYMDIANLDFTADTVRAPVLAEISQRQLSFQQDLAVRLQHAFGDALLTPQLSGWLSPFAAVVFRLCRGNRNRLPEEILILRERLASSREELAELEEGFRYGPTNAPVTTLDIATPNTSSSFAESQRSYSAYIKARNALLAEFGPTGQEVQGKELLVFSSNAALTALNPASPGAWIRAIDSLPLANIQSLLVNRRFAEIHRLKKDVPASAELLREISNLFGEEALREAST